MKRLLILPVLAGSDNTQPAWLHIVQHKACTDFSSDSSERSWTMLLASISASEGPLPRPNRHLLLRPPLPQCQLSSAFCSPILRRRRRFC